MNGDLKCVDKYFETTNKDQKKLWSMDSNEGTNDAEKEDIRPDPSKALTAILPPIDKSYSISSKQGSISEEATAQGDQPIF